MVELNKDTFLDTIKLLESINDLNDKVELDELDLIDLKKEVYNKTTNHSFNPIGSQQLDHEITHMQKIRNRERTMERTKSLLNRIMKALEKMKDEPDYIIIQMKYFQNNSEEEIAKTLNCSARSIFRKRNKLVSKLQIKLFGADALNL